MVALVKAADGTSSAVYEYGPFGELLRATGPMAKANPLRFSTKFQDDETDLLYYGYRYYNPSTGMWLSRDPMEESGGLNLYSFVLDDPLNAIDALGEAHRSRRIAGSNGAGAWDRSAYVVEILPNYLLLW